MDWRTARFKRAETKVSQVKRHGDLPRRVLGSAERLLPERGVSQD